MRARDYAKSKGYSLKMIASRVGQTSRTVSRWYDIKPDVFKAVVDGLRYQDMIKRELDR